MSEKATRPQINGWTVPERIWLMDLGGGDVTWCDQPDPDGEQVDSVEYVLALSRPDAAPADVAGTFQDRVQPWMMECFGAVIAGDKLERNDRFIEEALELVQACGYERERAHALVDYVFDRPAGEPHQEVGGVMVTLAALCLAQGLDMHAAAEDELARISVPEIVAKIRAKQAAKPTGSALPIAVPAAPAERADAGVDERARELLAEAIGGLEWRDKWLELWREDGVFGDVSADKALAAIKRALSANTPGRVEGLREVIAKWERGENHNEGAFDPACETCRVLADLRALIDQQEQG